MPNVTVTQLKKKNDVLKGEVAALRQNLESLNQHLNRNDRPSSSDGGQCAQLDATTLGSLEFYGKSYDDLNKSRVELNANLLCNFDKFNLTLGNLLKPFSVVGVSETWLDDATSELVNITGYNFVSNNRKSRTGGGVGIYLHKDLDYKLLPNCHFSDSELIESLFVEINVPHGKNIIVGTVYRPPNRNVASFLDKFNDILSKQCYIMGDFHLDLLQ